MGLPGRLGECKIWNTMKRLVCFALGATCQRDNMRPRRNMDSLQACIDWPEPPTVGGEECTCWRARWRVARGLAMSSCWCAGEWRENVASSLLFIHST